MLGLAGATSSRLDFCYHQSHELCVSERQRNGLSLIVSVSEGGLTAPAVRGALAGGPSSGGGWQGVAHLQRADNGQEAFSTIFVI